MSTYTQDITHLIYKIDTNIPDNDTQYITAARIRDAMGAVAYNYDLYVLKTDLDAAGYVTSTALQSQLQQAGYVTTTSLESALEPYVTESVLSGYATQDDLQTGMQSVLDDSYTYVVEKINEIPGVDLSSYVTKSQLNQELGSYVTKTELSEMGYVTESSLGNYVTTTSLQSALEPYVTETQLSSMSYATKTYVVDYVAEHTPIPDLSAYVDYDSLQSYLSSYVTNTELSEAGYLTVVPSEYVTDIELSLMGYVTQSQLSANSYITEAALGDYVTTTSLQSTLVSYVTETELSAAGYLTSIPSEYITETELSAMSYVSQTQLSSMSYATTSDLISKQDTLVSGTNIKTINNTSLLGSGDLTITVGSSISEVTQAQYDAMEQAGTLDPNTIYVITDAQSANLEDYVTKTELSNAGYLTSVPSEYVTTASLQSALVSYVTQSQLSANSYVTETELAGMNYVSHTELNSASYATTSQLNSKQDTLVSGTNIKTINNQSVLGSGNITISGGSGDVNVIESVSVNGTALVPDANKNVDVTVPTTTSQLTNNSGFLTSANFIYDSTNNTLTISI